MSAYPVKFPKSLVALFVRFKVSRFARQFHRPLVPDFQHVLTNPKHRRIWIYWGQGWAGAPDIVKRCGQSWVDRNPDWTVEFLDDRRLPEFIDVDGVPTDVSRTKQSNVWRMRLLERHGGVWVDATVFCSRALSDWLPLVAAPTGMFFFKTPTNDRPYDSWFWACFGESYLLRKYRSVYEPYLAEYGDRHIYALFYVFEFLLRTDRRFAAEYAAMPSVSAVPTVAYGRWLANPTKWPKPTVHGMPMHKLSWKKDFSLSDLEPLLDKAERFEIDLREG